MKHEPAKRVFVVVAYDISDDKRRTLLHQKLKTFGLAVQYSVFECLLNRDQINAMKKMIRANIKTKEGDRVRYYYLCESCRRRIEATDALIEQDAPVVFA
ncbi:MAG: CRISPR-associated endonuclease Cas2 [candidate division KSB1 bacterium]|nr:CRISPR-associated endonuclease Cas2 [candidate division KSB1 bacterium]